MLAFRTALNPVASSSGDPYFANVSLLLHFDGTNGSTSFVDSGPNGLAISRTGTPTISTTQSKFAGSSGLFPGSSYISAAASSLFFVGTGDFTVETWVYFNSVPTGSTIAPICQSDAVGVSSNNKWWFGYTAGTLRLGRHSTSNAAYCSWSPTTGVWYLLAVQRKSGTVNIYIDGVSQTITNNTIFSGVSFSQNGFVIGAISTPNYFNGYLDDFRLTVPVARLSSSYTPSGPFPNS